MRSVWITRHGGPEVLEVRDTPDPVPGPGQVRIRVKAAGLNFAELMARMGLYPDAPKLPAVVGYEVAGVVDAVGDGGRDAGRGRPRARARPLRRARRGGGPPGPARVPHAGRDDLRAGSGAAGELRDRLPRALPGRPPVARTVGARPHGRGRGGDRGHPARPDGARRDRLRDRLGRQARGDPRRGVRSSHRLPDPRLRRGGPPAHRRPGRRHGARRAGRRRLAEGVRPAPPRRAPRDLRLRQHGDGAAPVAAPRGARVPLRPALLPARADGGQPGRGGREHGPPVGGAGDGPGRDPGAARASSARGASVRASIPPSRSPRRAGPTSGCTGEATWGRWCSSPDRSAGRAVQATDQEVDRPLLRPVPGAPGRAGDEGHVSAARRHLQGHGRVPGGRLDGQRHGGDQGVVVGGERAGAAASPRTRTGRRWSASSSPPRSRIRAAAP